MVRWIEEEVMTTSTTTMGGEEGWIFYPIINSVNADEGKNGGAPVLVIKLTRG
jgi:hypothetical protein